MQNQYARLAVMTCPASRRFHFFGECFKVAAYERKARQLDSEVRNLKPSKRYIDTRKKPSCFDVPLRYLKVSPLGHNI